MNIVKAIKIKTNSMLSSNDYGLYYIPGGYSEFRFSESQLTGVDESWNDSFVIKNGIPDIVKKCDLLNSGNTVESNDITIKLNNTTQLDKFISNNSISLLRSIVEFHTFIGIDSDNDSFLHKIDGTRTIELIEYNESEMLLNVKMSLVDQRDNKLSIALDNKTFPYVPDSNINKYVPLIFGRSDPINKRFFVFYRSNSREEEFSNVQLQEWYHKATGNLSLMAPDFLSEFPSPIHPSGLGSEGIKEVYYADGTPLPTALIYLTLGNYIGQNFIDWILTNISDLLKGFYVYILKGDEDNKDQYRKIKSMLAYSSNKILVWITLEEFFTYHNNGNPTYTAVDQTWAKIYNLQNQYYLTYYPIDGFHENDGNEEVDFPLLFTKEQNGNVEVLIPILDRVSYFENDSKTLIFNPKYFYGAIDTVTSFKILPIKSIELCRLDSLDIYGETGYSQMKLIETTTIIPGAYKKGAVGGSGAGTTSSFTNLLNCIDKNSTTYARYAGITGIRLMENAAFVFIIKLPELDENIIFDNVYLGIKSNIRMTDTYSHGNGTFFIKKRAYYGPAEECVEQSSFDFKDVNAFSFNGTNIYNLPDTYFSDTPVNNDVYFYSKCAINKLFAGYKNFDLKINNKSEYKNVYEIAIIIDTEIRAGLTGIGEDITIDLFELAIIFEKTQDIKNEVFA